MATLSDIRAGLATRLATISGLNAHANWPDNIEEPSAIVEPTAGTYHESLGSPGASTITLRVALLVAQAQHGYPRSADLNPYLDDSGSQSIKAAIEGDCTLGGIVSTLIVTAWHVPNFEDGIGVINVSGLDYWGAFCHVEIYP